MLIQGTNKENTYVETFTHLKKNRKPRASGLKYKSKKYDNMARKIPKLHLEWDKILEIVAKHTQIYHTVIISNSHKKPVADARSLLVYFLRFGLDLTFVEIDVETGMLYSTAFANERRCIKRLSNPAFKAIYDKILAELLQLNAQ